MRAREVMVHAVDLGTGVTFADLPTDFLMALCEDIVARRGSAAAGAPSPGPAVDVETTDTGARCRSSRARGPSPRCVERSPPSRPTSPVGGGRRPASEATTGPTLVPTLPPWL